VAEPPVEAPAVDEPPATPADDGCPGAPEPLGGLSSPVQASAKTAEHDAKTIGADAQVNVFFIEPSGAWLPRLGLSLAEACRGVSAGTVPNWLGTRQSNFAFFRNSGGTFQYPEMNAPDPLKWPAQLWAAVGRRRYTAAHALSFMTCHEDAAVRRPGAIPELERVRLRRRLRPVELAPGSS
jgi:hypothetical protein